MIKRYLNDEYSLSKIEKFAMICAVFVISGVIGFLFETHFYQINNGGLSRRGTNFGPWINVHAIGGVLIYLLCDKFKRKPWLVVLICSLACSILEYGDGYILYHYFNGYRAWDYTNEILNFGNINGFICLRSVILFAISGILMIYLIVPFLINLKCKMSSNVFVAMAIVPAIIFFVDFTYNIGFYRITNTINATEFYTNSGIYQFVGNNKVERKGYTDNE